MPLPIEKCSRNSSQDLPFAKRQVCETRGEGSVNASLQDLRILEVLPTTTSTACVMTMGHLDCRSCSAASIYSNLHRTMCSADFEAAEKDLQFPREVDTPCAVCVQIVQARQINAEWSAEIAIIAIRRLGTRSVIFDERLPRGEPAYMCE